MYFSIRKFHSTNITNDLKCFTKVKTGINIHTMTLIENHKIVIVIGEVSTKKEYENLFSERKFQVLLFPINSYTNTKCKKHARTTK